MPTDLQIIDGFEALRTAMLEANPGTVLDPNPESSASMARAARPLAEVLEAWLGASLSLNGSTGQERRLLRALIRSCSAEDAGSPEESEAVLEAARPLLERHPRLLARTSEGARALRGLMNGDGKVAPPKAAATLAAEAAAWANLLPGLGGLKAWRMLERLGRAVIVPEARVRRFFWRLGLIEGNPSGAAASAARVSAEGERIAELTGMGMGALGRLMDWHTRRATGSSGGGRCVARPECDGCPIKRACAWARFHGGSEASEKFGAEAAAEAERIRARWEEEGADQLHEAELLAVLLHTGRRGMGALGMAEELLRRFGGLKGLDLASLEDLMRFKGIGEARARQIKAALEVGRRLSIQPLRRGDPVTHSNDVWLAFRDRYRHLSQEHFIVLLLDTKNRLIRSHIVSKGSISSSPAHPREVFKQAVRQSASGIILMHNHPSGDPEPSSEDLSVTSKLSDAGEVLGIRVLDHIILGDTTYYSFKDNGTL